MFDNLSVNSQQAITSLIKGLSAKVGKINIPAFDNDQKTLLALLAVYFNHLQPPLTGRSLADEVLRLNGSFKFEDITKQLESSDKPKRPIEIKKFRLGKIKAYSFRGLAPAGKEWEYDFEGKSHLIYGPNGSGKSSLIGAICWCFTGKIFRDDCAPAEPDRIQAYPAVGTSVTKIECDVAHSLIDENGNSSLPAAPYWVQTELIKTDFTSIFLRRENLTGLSWSQDGKNWVAIKSVTEIGLDPLDCELHLLTPAIASHLKFGKNPDLARLLASISGYGELEELADIAEGLSANCSRAATDIGKKELTPKENEIQQSIQKISEAVGIAIKELQSYESILNKDRTKEQVQEFGEAVKKHMDATTTQLAGDLGLEIPSEEDSAKYQQWEKQKTHLPGQASVLLAEVGKPLVEIFSESIGFVALPDANIIEFENKLQNFEILAIEKITEKLNWIEKEQKNKKLSLMLKASAYYSKEINQCPVCEQDLKKVPHIKEELQVLSDQSSKEYLLKAVDDFARAMIAKLDDIIPEQSRINGTRDFSSRINGDWERFKKTYCKELMLSIAIRYDGDIQQAASPIQKNGIAPFNIPGNNDNSNRKHFLKFAEELDNAKKYIELCRSINRQKQDMINSISDSLIKRNDIVKGLSLKETLERAKTTISDLEKLISVYNEAKKLWQSVKNVEEIKKRIADYTKIAESAKIIKSIKQTIRTEVKDLVTNELGKKTKENYEKLYHNEVLKFEQLTTGHAANPDIKDEINLYLKAGEHLVPMGPFSNAGRMRALLLSFVFALLDKSVKSLDLIIFDDPAISLDDEHKARFVDNLVAPLIKSGQVILGTHYRSFFENSEYVFADSIKLKMIPRQRYLDRVQFETEDLLERVEISLQKNSGDWEESAGNIRKWIERTIATISGYCPTPFLTDKLGTSINNYANINDRQIVTENRTKILGLLRSPKINRIADPAHHNETIIKADVEDALREIIKCKKIVAAEIKYFQKLYNHNLSNRHLTPCNQIDLESHPIKQDLISKSLYVIRAAAAAHNATGIEWGLSDEYPLNGCPVVQVCTDIIEPIALVGQYLLLDWEDREAKNGNIVVLETEDKQKYVRRIWKNSDGALILEGTNPTKPSEPIFIASGKCKIRRVVGVLYDEPTTIDKNGEWSMRGVGEKWFDDIVGIRVKGTSLEPLALDGQIILVKKKDIKANLTDDMLVCASIQDKGDVIKRYFANGKQCILCAINQTEREIPILVNISEIQQAYALKGVIFETGRGKELGY